MSAPRCSRLWQAEAIADGRLTDPDADAFERHVSSCADCAGEVRELERLRQLTARLPSLRASELERRRQRNELLRQANEATVRAPRARGGFMAAAAIGGVMITAASAFGLRAAWQELIARDRPAEQAPTADAKGARSSERAVPPRAGATADRALEDDRIPSDALAPPPETEPAPRVRRTRSAPAPQPRVEAQTERAGPAFAKAMAAFSAGDYGSAHALFAAFEREHGADDRVEDAVFLRAVSHARRGDRTASRAVASEYLRRYPNGLRKREAEQLAR